MKTIAFITDQHFDLASRWTEHTRIMEWLVRDVAQRRPVAIALGGDLYERSPRPEEVRAACEWLVALARIAPVVGVRGNHDPKHSTVPFNMLESAHPIRFYEAPAVHVCEWGGIACLPWPERAQLLATIGHDTPREQANQIAADALRSLLVGMSDQLDDVPGARLFLGHVQLRAATVSTGQPLAPGADFELGLEDLALLRADAYLCGHIHRPSHGEAEINGAPCFYGGSPRRTAFGELETKSYSLVDIDERPARVIAIPTPCAKMFLLNAKWSGTEFMFESCLSGCLPIEGSHVEVAGAEVRFRYECDSDQREAARSAAVKIRDDLLARGASRVQVEAEVRSAQRARAPEVARATTLESKLAALWAARGTTPDDARRERLLRLAYQVETEVSNAA